MHTALYLLFRQTEAKSVLRQISLLNFHDVGIQKTAVLKVVMPISNAHLIY